MRSIWGIAAIGACLWCACGCASTRFARDEPLDVTWRDGRVRMAVVAEELMAAVDGVRVRALEGSWRDRSFVADCVLKKRADGTLAIAFLAPQVRLVTITLSPPHGLRCERARQIPAAFEPEYALADLAVAELGADALRRALAPDFSVVERGCELTVFRGTEAVARRTARPDGSRRYENFVHGYAFTVRDAQQ